MKRRSFLKALPIVAFAPLVARAREHEKIVTFGDGQVAVKVIPSGFFPCSKCGEAVKPEEWMIPPYLIYHGTCKTCGPVWGFDDSVEADIRNYVSTLKPPGYRDQIPIGAMLGAPILYKNARHRIRPDCE